MPSEKISFRVVPVKTTDNFIKKEAQNTIKELKKFLKGEGSRTLVTDMEGTVRRWDHKPQIVSDYSEPRGNMQVHIHPKGRGTENWQRISGGTGPRTIHARSIPMTFPRKYRPKTTPAGIWTGPGQRYGEIVRTYIVRRHTIEAREFSKKIKAKREAYLLYRMQLITDRIWK